MEIPAATMKKTERNGWQAKTVIPVPGIIEKDTMASDEPGAAQLEITTSKRYDGGISTYANVVYKTDYGFRTALGLGGGGDYGRSVTSDPKARCTEKKVREFHDAAMQHIEAVIADVQKHYGLADIFTAPEPVEA